MTSPYTSATEVVDAMATTGINDHQPNPPQLTAVAGDVENLNAQIGSAIDENTLIQEPSEKKDDAVEDHGPGFQQDDAQDITAEAQNSDLPEQLEDGQATAFSTDPNSMTNETTNGLQDAGVLGSEVLQDDAQLVTANGQLTQQFSQDFSAQPELQNSAQISTENEQQMQFYSVNQDAAGLMGGGQNIIASEQQALDFYNTLPMDEAQALMSIQMMNQLAQQPYLDPSPMVDVESERIQAYAKIEFPDGEFYMNTFSIILGRDIVAARAAMRRDKDDARRKIEQEADPESNNTPVRVKHEGSRYSKSVFSETGGILGRDCDDSDSDRFAKKKRSRKASKKSKSTGSSSNHVSRRNSVIQPDGPITYQPQNQLSRRLRPETDGAAPVDSTFLRPSPYECPLIGLHPPAAAPASAYKAISRKHVRIAHNSDKHLFEAEILGRNGAFIDDEFCHYGEFRELKSGSELLIGTVTIKFVLPDVAYGETGAEQQRIEYEGNLIADRYSEGGKEMSFDFEDGPRDGVNMDESSEESSDEERVQIEDPDEVDQGEDSGEEVAEEVDEQEEDEEEDEEDEDEDEEDENIQNRDLLSFADDLEEEEELEQSVEQNELPKSAPKGEKKRGPGRPPKDGVMSKRQQKEAKKAAAEAEELARQKQAAKKTVQQTEASTSTFTTGKNKVGRPRKHPKPDTPLVQKEKRKYTKRKPKEPKDPALKQEGEGDDEASKEKKEKKAVKPARSPSPEFNESELTAEQLAKPNVNYVTLIHEAISNSATGQMSLPQIYRAIQRKYPYFKVKTQTNGWQSSVRHNLSQHHAFQKGDKDGKGYLWSVVNGVSIEKEKKRRMTPPPGHPHMHQPIYQAGYPQYMHYPPGMMPPPPPPGYAPMPPSGQPFPHPQFMGQANQNGHPPYPGHQPQINGNLMPQYPIPLPQLAQPSTGTYSSPYAPKPVVSAPTLNEQRPNSQPQAPAQNSIPPTAAPHEPQVAQEGPSVAPLPPQAGAFRPDDTTRNMVESLKPTILKMLKDKKSDNPEAILESVVNRVLGITTASTVNDDPLETLFMGILKKQLSAINEGSNKSSVPVSAAPQQNNAHQPEAQPPTNQVGTQGNAPQQPPKSIGSERLPTQVMRPQFTGRVNGASISRPPMKTSGMQRTNSGSPANAPPRQSVPPSSASPAATSPMDASPAAATQPPVTTNGANTPKLIPTGNEQLPTVKNEPCEGANDVRESKRLNEDGQFSGLKRSLEDAEEHQDFKRLATAGPPQLKT